MPCIWVASSINNDQARLEEARSMFVRVIDVYRRKLPPDDPKITAAMAGLAWTLGSQKRYAESLAAYEELLRIHRRYRGPESIAVATTLHANGRGPRLEWPARGGGRDLRGGAADHQPGAGPRILLGLHDHG